MPSSFEECRMHSFADTCSLSDKTKIMKIHIKMAAGSVKQFTKEMTKDVVFMG